MAKEVKVLSLNNLDRWQIDIIEDITRTESPLTPLNTQQKYRITPML
jgi:hypothetical protein